MDYVYFTDELLKLDDKLFSLLLRLEYTYADLSTLMFMIDEHEFAYEINEIYGLSVKSESESIRLGRNTFLEIDNEEYLDSIYEFFLSTVKHHERWYAKLVFKFQL